MKKIAILTALFVAISCGSAFATYVAGTVTKTGFEVQLSNKVSMDYNPQASGLGYTVASYHLSGTKTFGSSSGDSKIFWIDGVGSDATGTGAPTTPDAPSGTASAAFGSWTAL